MPRGRVCFTQGDSPVSFFSKLFGRSNRRRAAVEMPTARHRREEDEAGQVPGMRGAPQDGYQPAGERPLFRDAGYGASVDPSGGPRIGFPSGPSTSGGGFAPESYAGHVPGGVPRQEAANMTGPIVCPRCGNQNPATARFCNNCGSPLRGGAPEMPAETTSTISISGLESYDPTATGTGATPALSAEVLAAIDALPPGSALLIVQRGPNSGSRFLLDADVTTAGRHPQGDIFLDDVTVSRRHVEFRRRPGGFSVADVGSLNGTYVNRERIDEVGLNNGDEVQIGKYRLVFFAGPQRY
ncbi:FHA domain-containing protein [Kitasatospora sp. NBC_01250]|nr:MULTISPECIES: FHA domain-containing protein [unclassified Kitasatospora]WSJ72136.1 FHA domain-containing protein [Kitasatospora sp. NBC_01302]